MLAGELHCRRDPNICSVLPALAVVVSSGRSAGGCLAVVLSCCKSVNDFLETGMQVSVSISSKLLTWLVWFISESSEMPKSVRKASGERQLMLS